MFHGSIVALITPMKPDGHIDESAFVDLLEWQLQSKTDAIVVNGTTGEAATTTPEEKAQLLKLAKSQIRDRVPLIAGTGSPCTRTAVEMTLQAKSMGVDACLILTPCYVKPTQEGLVNHYAQIAQAVNLPLLLYNAPGRTACDLLPETAIHLGKEFLNIVGIKEASGDLTRIEQIRTGLDRDFDILTGEDGSALDFLKKGGMGVISVTANVMPEKMSALCRAAKAQDWVGARGINDSLSLLHEALFLESNPIPVKWALKERGLIQQGIRPPLTWLSLDKEAQLKTALRQASI